MKYSGKLEPPGRQLAVLFQRPGVGDLRLLGRGESCQQPAARWTWQTPRPGGWEGITYFSACAAGSKLPRREEMSLMGT